jgi:predicted dehydrogenase
MVVRIGMIGAGRMANMHAGRLAELREARIVVIAGPLSECAAQPGERTGATAHADHGGLGV